jgi:hypothetical protein
MSVFNYPRKVRAKPLTARERFFIAEECLRRGLEATYYEATATLWMRVKSEFYDAPVEVLEFLQTICLHLAVKFIGPKNLIFGVATVPFIQSRWPGITLQQVADAELNVLYILEWKLF